MLERLKTYWNYGSRFASVEITSIDNATLFHIVTASIRKGEFEDVQTFEFESLEELKSNLPKIKHCFVSINTDKVLIKRSEYFQDELAAVQNAFSSISTSDFYYQVLKEGESCFVAIARKDLISKIVSDFKYQKLEVIGISFGFLSLSMLLEAISDITINTSRQQVVFKQNNIDGFTNDWLKPIKVTIEGILLQSDKAISLAGLAGYQVPYIGFGSIGSYNQALSKDHSQKRLFTNGIKLAAIFLFAMLLINAAMFGHYYKKQQALTQEASLADSQKELYSSKLAAVNKKETVVANMLSNGGSKSSFFINRIASSLPNELNLSVINYNPIEGAIRDKKPIIYNERQLLLAGFATENSAFSKWMNVLEGLDFVENVEIIGFKDDSSGSNFEIKVKIK